MAASFRERLIERVRGWPVLTWPAIVAAVGLVATLAGTYMMEQGRQARESLRFDAIVDQANEAVANRLDTYMAVLRAGAGLFAASEDVSAAEFRAFARRVELTRRYPGIQGIGYTVRAPAGGEAALAAYMRAEGVPAAPLRPSAEGELYAIVYLEPLDFVNRRALGFNMYAFPVRREAMDRARDTGLPALSGKVEAVEEVEGNRQAGFLIYEPVYHGGEVPPTVAARRELLMGFVYAPFQAGDLLASVLPAAKSAGLDYAVYDGAPSVATLLNQSPDAAAQRGGLVATRTLDIAGRTWTIIYRARTDYDHGADRWVTLAFIVGGLLATTLVSLATWRQVRARLAAEREIVARIAAEARQKLLLDELNHRVKNTLATVQSIAAQSLRGATDPAQVYEKLEARLLGLSQAHDVLTRERWHGADLREVAERALAPFDSTPGTVRVSGPKVWLPPAPALTMALIFHELATNAVKYGALSRAGGHVDLAWSLTEDGQAWTLIWAESGGPPTEPPTRKGFCTRLIERGLSGELRGSASVAYRPNGLTWTMRARTAARGDAAGGLRYVPALGALSAEGEF